MAILINVDDLTTTSNISSIEILITVIVCGCCQPFYSIIIYSYNFSEQWTKLLGFRYFIVRIETFVPEWTNFPSQWHLKIAIHQTNERTNIKIGKPLNFINNYWKGWKKEKVFQYFLIFTVIINSKPKRKEYIRIINKVDGIKLILYVYTFFEKKI